MPEPVTYELLEDMSERFKTESSSESLAPLAAQAALLSARVEGLSVPLLLYTAPEREEIGPTEDENVHRYLRICDFRRCETKLTDTKYSNLVILTDEMSTTPIDTWFEGVTCDESEKAKDINILDFVDSIFISRDEPRESVESFVSRRAFTAIEYLALLRNTYLEEFVKKIIDRVEVLSEIAADEGDDQQGLTQESLSGLMKFLYVHRGRIDTQPSIILTINGHLRAEWRNHADHRIAIEFVNDKSVMFVTFLPDRMHPTRTNRVSGAAGIETFFETTGVSHL